LTWKSTFFLSGRLKLAVASFYKSPIALNKIKNLIKIAEKKVLPPITLVNFPLFWVIFYVSTFFSIKAHRISIGIL
jgi:hypothetical protein